MMLSRVCEQLSIGRKGRHLPLNIAVSYNRFTAEPQSKAIALVELNQSSQGLEKSRIKLATSVNDSYCLVETKLHLVWDEVKSRK